MYTIPDPKRVYDEASPNRLNDRCFCLFEEDKIVLEDPDFNMFKSV